jgi:hypothetical protein
MSKSKKLLSKLIMSWEKEKANKQFKTYSFEEIKKLLLNKKNNSKLLKQKQSPKK